MRTRTSTWFETKVSYDKVAGGGTVRKITEMYAIDALSFTEAESRIIAEVAIGCAGIFDVKTIAVAPYKEVLFTDEDAEDKWYKVKVAMITIDEKTGKEKQQPVVYLVQADKPETSLQHTKDMLGGDMPYYKVISSVETKILDVFEHIAHEE